MRRYVVVLQREDQPQVIHGKLVECLDDTVIVGPFRSKARATLKARAVARLANTYEDPEGVTGEGNALHVFVQPILSGPVAARDVLAVMYGSVATEDLR